MQVSDEWWHFVRSFGLRVSRTDEDFGGYDLQTRSVEGSDRHGKPCDLYGTVRRRRLTVPQDICYNIRYPDRIARTQEYPWVHRQLAAYHSYYPKSRESRWILLQPSDAVEQEIRNVLSQSCLEQCDKGLSCQWLIHSVILKLTGSNWRGYLNHLEQEVVSFVCLDLTLLRHGSKISCFAE